MKHQDEVKRIVIKNLRTAFGAFLILLGISGIILPILPGWLFIIIGIEFAGFNFVFYEKIKAYALKKVEESKKKSK
jgi:uncharacterized protein YqgC (DUF456 family)